MVGAALDPPSVNFKQCRIRSSFRGALQRVPAAERSKPARSLARQRRSTPRLL